MFFISFIVHFSSLILNLRILRYFFLVSLSLTITTSLSRYIYAEVLEKKLSEILLHQNNFSTQLQISPKLKDRTIFQYRFDKISEKKDLSAKVLWQEGIYEKAPFFLGKDSFVVLPKLTGYQLVKNQLSSFTLEFYFRPEVYRIEETLLNIEEIVLKNNHYTDIQLNFKIKNRRLVWEGQNLFHFKERDLSVSLSSPNEVTYGKWNKASISFDRTTGRLKLTLNNRSKVDYATSDRSIFGTIFYAGFDSPPKVILGSDFNGKIDLVSLFPQPNQSYYHTDNFADYTSKVFPLASLGTPTHKEIYQITLQGEAIQPSALKLYICSSLNYFLPIKNPTSLTLRSSQKKGMPHCEEYLPSHKSKTTYPKLTFLNNITFKKKNEIPLKAKFIQLFIMYKKFSLLPKSALAEKLRLDTIKFDLMTVPLPLPLNDFLVEKNSDGILLSWETSNLPNLGYEVIYWSQESPENKKVISIPPVAQSKQLFQYLISKNNLQPHQVYQMATKVVEYSKDNLQSALKNDTAKNINWIEQNKRDSLFILKSPLSKVKRIFY